MSDETNDTGGPSADAPATVGKPSDVAGTGGPLTPKEMDIIREAEKDHANPGASLERAWERIQAGRQTGGEKPAEDTTTSAGPKPSSPNADVSTEAGQNLADADTVLREASGDVINSEALSTLGKFSAPYARHLDNVMAQGGEDALHAEMDKGDAKVLQMLYHNNDAERAEGLETISKAVALFEAKSGAPAETILNQINGSGILSDPRSHMMLLSMARSMLKQQS